MELLQQVNEGYYDGTRSERFNTQLVVTKEHLRQARGNKMQVIANMRPEDFLKLTTSENNDPQFFKDRCKSIDDYNKWAEEGENIIMPSLWIKEDRISGHEGRHRAAALVCAGAKEMSVALRLYPEEEHQEKYGYWEAPYEIKWEDFPRAIYGQYGKGIVLRSDIKPVIDGWNHLQESVHVMEARYAHDPHTVADQYNQFGKELNYGHLRDGDDTELWVKDTGITGKHAWVITYIEADNEEQAISRMKHYVTEYGLPYSDIKVPGQLGNDVGFEGMWLVIVEYKQ